VRIFLQQGGSRTWIVEHDYDLVRQFEPDAARTAGLLSSRRTIAS
jgi:hypothetical protein